MLSIMDIVPRPITTEEDYRRHVEEISWLANGLFKKAEACMSEGSHASVQDFLPSLISTVNVIAYLRGGSTTFTEMRPTFADVGEMQHALYANEDAFERRLRTLIDFVMASPSARYYVSKLEMYYVKNRS